MGKADELPAIISESIERYPLRDDVVGQAGQFIEDFQKAMKGEQIYNMMGVQPDKTFLITGKAGTGKTLGVEALINEVNKDVIDIMKTQPEQIKLLGFKYDIGKYGTAYINMGSRIAQHFFDTVFKITQQGYSTLSIFDEGETIFGNRAENTGHKEDNKLLDTIMKNMQELHDMPGAYAVIMSNFPEAFDSASIRAGRIDKRYEFKMPGELERKLAFNHQINSINECAGYQVVRKYDSSELANNTNNFSYADISETIRATVKQRAKEIIDNRTNNIIPAGYVSQKRLLNQIDKHNESFKKSKPGIGFK